MTNKNTYQIYVAPVGSGLALTRGRGVAVCIPEKGDKSFYVLLDSGTIASVKGSRIAGVGVLRYLKESGFSLAADDNSDAIRLADLVDMRKAPNFVYDASVRRAREIQRTRAGQNCTFIPFDPERPSIRVTVAPESTFAGSIYDLAKGVSSATIEIEHHPETMIGIGTTLSLSEGWLLGPEDPIENAPRISEYGSLIEQAAYFICNAGLGRLEGPPHLEMADNTDDEGSIEWDFCRGHLRIALTNGDRLLVGSDAMDELLVRYQRDGATLYERHGLEDLRLGDAIAAIGAALVRVAALDAAPKPRAKARKAA